MANQLIDDVLNSTDIVDVVSKYVPLKRAGSNFVWCCPFHNEKTPSFVVSPTKQIFKCFGCWEGWNVISFVQKIERIDFWDAIKELAKNQHIDLEKYDINIKKVAADSDEKWKLKRMHSLAQNYFKEQLSKSKTATKYLIEERHIPQQLIELFWIGYAPDKHYELIQLLREKWFTDSDILEWSFAKKNANSEIYGFFRNRITFPIYDIMGNIVWYSARVINPEDKPKYLNSAEHKAFEKSKILYGLNFAKNNIKQHQKIIIVEGQMDVLWLARLWFPVWVATSWTALTEEHVKLLKRYTENIYLMFDNDNAWNQATQRALKLFYQQNIFPKTIHIPSQWKDADNLANEENGKTVFEQCLKESKDWFVSSYEALRQTFDMTSPIDKQKLINTMFELILSVDSLAIQEHYKWVLAEKLGFAYEILNAQFKKFKSTDWRLQIVQQSRRQETQKKENKFHLEREYLFVALFRNDNIKNYLWETKSASLISFAKLLTKAYPDSPLARTFNATCSEEESKKIEELTLRWDKQLDEIATPEKKHQVIIQTVLPYIQNVLQLALKSPNLSNDEKKELLQIRKSL